MLAFHEKPLGALPVAPVQSEDGLLGGLLPVAAPLDELLAELVAPYELQPQGLQLLGGNSIASLVTTTTTTSASFPCRLGLFLGALVAVELTTETVAEWQGALLSAVTVQKEGLLPLPQLVRVGHGWRPEIVWEK